MKQLEKEIEDYFLNDTSPLPDVGIALILILFGLYKMLTEPIKAIFPKIKKLMEEHT